MIEGNSAEWDEFFAGKGVPAVLALVLNAWEALAPPAAGEREDATSVRLYAAMLKKQDRQAHPFLIRYQDVEVDVDLAKETGRKDIVFFPCHDGDIYFCLEAKRLNVRVNGVMKSLADEYVKEGMRRFVVGKYSRHVHHGGMLGYVLDGDIPRAMQNVLDNIRARHAQLGMDAPGDWAESPFRPGDSRARESGHRRSHTAVRFRLQHQFVSGVGTATPRGRPTKPTRSRSAEEIEPTET
jgi:hypothetical protein